MNAARTRARWVALILLLLVWQYGVARAVPPLASLIGFQRIDADPNKPYALIQDNGPWLIMATTFEGPQAAQDAQKLVYDLRKNYKIPAYTHEMTFDFTEKMSGRGMDRFGQQQRMQYSRGGKVNEVAVLAGDFSSFDDPQAKKLLDRIKYLKPASLVEEQSKADAELDKSIKHAAPLGGAGASPESPLAMAGPNTTQPDATPPPVGAYGSRTFAAIRDKLLPGNSARKNMGPMRLAFITTNPLLPESYYQPKGVDRLVVEMNKGLEYSLLDCRGRYTVRVATFRGNVVIDPRRIKQIESSDSPENKDRGEVKLLGKMKTRLHQAAQNAHDVTVYLRAKGFEAYEFHDRDSSFVTVGSFSSPGVQNADGSILYTPAIRAVIDRFKEKPYEFPNHTFGPVMPQQIKPLSREVLCFDPTPIVIEVPRRSYSGDYARGLLHVQ